MTDKPIDFLKNQIKHLEGSEHINLENFFNSSWVKNPLDSALSAWGFLKLYNKNFQKVTEEFLMNNFEDELIKPNILRFTQWRKGVLTFVNYFNNYGYDASPVDSICDLMEGLKEYSEKNPHDDFIKYLIKYPKIIQKEWDKTIATEYIVSDNGFGIIHSCLNCQSSLSNCENHMVNASIHRETDPYFSELVEKIDLKLLIQNIIGKYKTFLLMIITDTIIKYYNEGIFDFGGFSKEMGGNFTLCEYKTFILNNRKFLYHYLFNEGIDLNSLYYTPIETDVGGFGIKEIDLRTELTIPFKTKCYIKKVQLPKLDDFTDLRKNYGSYTNNIQEFVFYDANTKKTIKGKLIGDLCDYDEWNKNDYVEIVAIYRNHELSYNKWERYLDVLNIKHADSKESIEPSNFNRNQETPEYDNWRNEVLKRDNYTCQCCGYDKIENLEVHHDFGYKEYPELAIDINNGIVLCKWCHDKYHSIYGLKNINPRDLVEFIKNHAVR